jgi:hypothetical protein
MGRSVPNVARLLLALTLLAPVDASAGVPYDVGDGAYADLALRPDGRAYVAWTRHVVGEAARVEFCRLENDINGCAAGSARTLPVPAGGGRGTRPVIWVDPANVNTLVVIQGQDITPSTTFRWTSGNGGDTWSAPVAAATNELYDEAVAITSPTPGFIGVRAGPGTSSHYQFIPLTGGTETQKASPLPESNSPFRSARTIGMAGDRPVVAVQAGSPDQIRYWKYKDSASISPFTNTNSAANWDNGSNIGPGSVPRLAFGPSGLVLLIVDGTDRRFETLKFAAGSWTPAGAIAGDVDPGLVSHADLFQAPGGRLVAAMPVSGALRVSSSTDGAASWSNFIEVARGESYVDPQVVAGADGQGFAAWSGANGKVRATTLEPAVDSPPPGPGPGPNPGPAPNPSPGPNPSPNPRSPDGKPGPVATVVIGNEEVTFIAPTQCVASGTRVTLRVTSKAKKRVAGKKGRSRIRRVIFSAGNRKKTDKKAAFRATFATKGMRAGSKHKLAARVRLRQILKPRKNFNRTLKGALTICP